MVCLLVLQPVMGYLHHLHFAKHQRRGIISHLHIWYGRVLMVLGVINGGLGLQLASASHHLIIAYSVVAGVIFAGYIAFAAWGAFREKIDGRPRKEESGSSSPQG